MTPEYAKARITKLRMSLLAFRFMYYVWSESLITDFDYDRRETELKALIAEWPGVEQQCEYAAECPTRTVGSALHEDYPAEVQSLAERLMLTHSEIDGLEQPVPLPELESDLARIAATLYVAAPPKLQQPGLF